MLGPARSMGWAREKMNVRNGLSRMIGKEMALITTARITRSIHVSRFSPAINPNGIPRNRPSSLRSFPDLLSRRGRAAGRPHAAPYFILIRDTIPITEFRG